MDILDELNEPQKRAVAAPTGQVLVLAGPGSGKTRVLTLRVAYLIGALNVRPYHICAVTFTNKAAREMKKRLDPLLGEEQTAQLWLGTFHAICARILRREASHLTFKSSFVIYDADDQVALVKRAIQDLNLDEKKFRPNSVHGNISNAKNHLIWPRDYPRQNYRDEVVARIYGHYQRLLEANNAVDFDDLLMLPVRLLEENPDLREQYARRFEHLLVDEFQDTNGAQYRLLQLLSSYYNNLFVVGDEDQSIYRWRGADYRNVLRFEKDYPDCSKILLEQNYRSTQNVLNVATAVIDQNKNRTRKDLFTHRGNGEKIHFFEAPDDYSEAAYVVDNIRNALESGKSRGGDFAIMYRINAQSRLLEDAFLRSGIPYRLVGAQRFYGRREIKDIIAYLRLVYNPSDEISLQRVINVPARKIGERTMASLQQAAQQNGLQAGELLVDLGRNADRSAFWNRFTPREARLLADFGTLLVQWRQEASRVDLPALFDRILHDIGYRQYLEADTEDGIDRWENGEELRSLASEFSELGLVPFLENLALVSDQDTLPDKQDAPTLLTLHAAKGLEFPNVFIVGLDDGMLPHSRSIDADDPEEMAEERRLFYVGITRAKNHLTLVRAEYRRSYGSPQLSQPSRFLEDIPQNLLAWESPHRVFLDKKSEEPRSRLASSYSWNHRSDSPAARWESPQPSPRKSQIAPRQAQFNPGQRVRTTSWGEGVVLESRMDDNEEIVVVQFESVGLKRLIASLAKLEIMS